MAGGGDWNIVAEPTFESTLKNNGLHGRDVSMRRLKNQNRHICSYRTAVHFNADMNMRLLTVTYNCEIANQWNPYINLPCA